jgi:chaperonin GroES
MNIRPLNDRVLVRRIPEPEAQTYIVRPESAQVPSTWGQVVAVGPGKMSKKGWRVPVGVKPGEVVIFGPYVDFDKDDLVMIQEQDIRGVVYGA